MEKERHIKALLDKYLDGETSAAEELTLREYFASAGDGIPEEWRPYKALFAFVDGERQAEAKQPVRRHTAAMRHLRRIAVAASIAAAVAATVVMRQAQPSDGYAVINGKVYTDRKTVEEEALDALQMVSTDYDDTFDALDMMKR